jgi:putative oxidoreductase
MTRDASSIVHFGKGTAMNRPTVAARTAHPAHADLAALLLRLALGVLYLAHSLQKIFVFTLPGAAQFFVSVGFPGWLAYVTTFVELFGGIALLLGVQVRWVALVLLPFMLGALSVHFHNGWGFASPNGGWEYPAFWAVALVVQSLLGNGLFALGNARAPQVAGRVGA